MSQRKWLNLGCGRIILPAPKPAHYSLLDNITEFALWHNVDRNQQPGVDRVMDIFKYPWTFADNSFDGALLAHICEHIPHEIKLDWADVALQANERNTSIAKLMLDHNSRANVINNMQDGWFAFFSELWRVCSPGSIIHILSPYGWSDAGITDPSHTRLLTPASFLHSMQPDPNAPFAYATGGLHLEMVEAPRVNLMPAFQHLAGHPELLQQALGTQINVAYEFALKMRVVK